MNIDAHLLARILSATIESEKGCLEWQRSKQRGYGKISVNGRAYRVHRIMCEAENGPAPQGRPYALHKCNNRACVRGDHLYWGDQRQNIQDAIADGVHFARYRGVEQCVNGHEFTPDNTYEYVRRGKPHVTERKCKECNRTRAREWARAKRKRAAA